MEEEELPLFTTLDVELSKLVLMNLDELKNNFGDFVPVKEQSVFVSEDYAVKISPLFSKQAKDLSNEARMLNLLNELGTRTQIFAHGYGFILSKEHPLLSNASTEDYYAYLFSEKIGAVFRELPDEPKINEDFYFEVLIGIYYARKAFNFTHYDIHEGNLMFNRLEKPTVRTYRIGETFFVTIRDSGIAPKLIDYGKSAADPSYSDERWNELRFNELRFKKFWNKSDIYHLSWIFLGRTNLSDRFREFLKRVTDEYQNSQYARQLDKDSAANFGNIEQLLKDYFGETVNCVMCENRLAQFTDGTHPFCGNACRIRFVIKHSSSS